MIGMIQPKKSDELKKPDLYQIGCIGKIISFNEIDDGRYLIIINGISRFKIIKELSNKKLYRLYEISYQKFENDRSKAVENVNFEDLKIIFKDLKNLFKKKGFLVDWSNLKNKDLNYILNTLSMASPFSIEEKQILLETIDINSRKIKLEEILKTYTLDNFNNKTIQ